MNVRNANNRRYAALGWVAHLFRGGGLAITRRRAALGMLALAMVMQYASPTLADPIADFYKLEDKLMEAQEAFLAARHNSREPGVQAKPSPDPRAKFLEQMDKLADANAGKPNTATIAAGAFMWSWNLDLDLPHLTNRFDRLVDHYAGDATIDDVLPAVTDAAQVVSKPEDWIKAVTRLIKNTERTDTRLAARFTLGQIQLHAKKLGDAKASFQEILKAGTDADYADLARGYIFEIDHLQIGMVAPDFTAKTIDGKDVTLRSLRGKIVLLNFWASW